MARARVCRQPLLEERHERGVLDPRLAPGGDPANPGHPLSQRSSPAQFAVTVAAVAVISWLPVLVGATTRAAFGWAAAAALALLAVWLTRRLEPNVLVTALVLSSALV